MAFLIAWQMPAMAQKAAQKEPPAVSTHTPVQKAAVTPARSPVTRSPATSSSAAHSSSIRSPGSNSPVAAPATASKVSNPIEKTYMTQMQPLVQKYDQIMLALVAPGDDNSDAGVSAAETNELAQEIAATLTPQELAEQHKLLARSLLTVAQFLTTGGRAAHGFHDALVVAERMQAISSSYHNAVLACLKAHSLPVSLDPFLDPRAAAAFDAQQRASGNKAAAHRGNGGRRQFATFNRPVDSVDPEREARGPFSDPTAPAMINGVDGSMSMTGLFNGLGGTSTNGLVDGLGVSSGMNGLVNGAGLSQGMSGRLNDTTTGADR